MRRTHQIAVSALLGLSCVSPALAQTGPLDARAVRPAVMLMVDTSGSMERLPDDGGNAGCDDCLPQCTGNTAQDSSQKNRWAVTLEALTGTFQDYSCQAVDRSSYPPSDYDYGYYLPHIDFTTNASQMTDGILDSFANRVKFGLMTFDGVGTTIGGETLVPFSMWSNASFQALANGAPGMYSYGQVGRLSFPGCPTDYGVNAGARGPGDHPGALISVGLSDNVDDVIAVNQRIQSSLLTVRPFGGTPIAAMLSDLNYYLRTDPDINASGDPYYACRKRVGVLITDGAPDALFRDSRFQCDFTPAGGATDVPACAPSSVSDDDTPSCECPYLTAELEAEILVHSQDELLEQLVVVAYNVHDPAALSTLNAIAERGWPTGMATRGSEAYPYLIQANGPSELREQIDDLLDGAQPGVTSRSVPIAVNTGRGPLGDANRHFEITAGFQLGRNSDEAWSGLLYRRRLQCSGTTVAAPTAIEATQGDSFHESLDLRNPASRDLFTYVPATPVGINGTLRNGGYTPAPVVPSDAENFDGSRLSGLFNTRNNLTPTGGTFSNLVPTDSSVTATQGIAVDSVTRRAFDNGLLSTFFGDANDNNVPGEPADRAAIVEYVRGESASRPHALGDIYHSNPVAVPPLRASTIFVNELASDFTDWQRQLVTAGANGRYSEDFGRPGVVYVGTNDGILHAFNLDDWSSAGGTAVAGGQELWGFLPPALFGKMAAMVAPTHQFMFDGTPIVKDVVLQKRPSSPALFRTVLVAALRGAPAFVALDVTFPESPQFLWQVTFPDVGDTVGNPALTQVNVTWNGEQQQRAVAILPGGAGQQTGTCPNGRAVSGDTRANSPDDARNNVRCWRRRGRSLYVVDVATGDLLQEFGPEHFPSPLTGAVAADSIGLGASSAAYFFDHDGVLWRLSMLGTDPSRWRVAPIYDMFAAPVIGNSTPAPADWQVGRAPHYAPLLTRNRQGEVVILAGTGDIDNVLDTARQRVVSLTERRADSAGQIGGTVVLNWRLDLEENEAVTGPLTIFQDNVYFGSFVRIVEGGQCSLGQSYIYGAHAYEPEPVGSTSPRPALIPNNAEPEDPTRVVREVYDPSGNNLLIGLTVARQPICQGDPQMNYITGQNNAPMGGGMFQLKATMAPNSAGGQAIGQSSITEMIPRTLQSSTPSSMSAWVGAVE